MKKIICAFFLIFAISGFSYCQAMDMPELADTFQKATDLQRDQIIKDNLTDEISCSGIVANVGQYDFFDIVTDFKGVYYQVSLEQQKTADGVAYQVIYLFKNKEEVKDINKGQDFKKSGKIIRIVDERLQISVWLLCGELTDNDKLLFKQDLSS